MKQISTLLFVVLIISCSSNRTFLLVPAQQYVGAFLATFQEFPPSQKPGSFSLDKVMEALQQRKD